MNNKSCKVTVCVVTYNQEKYIEDCLKSILDQETDFPFDVIVSDDCSFDSTRSILNNIAANNPNVKLVYKKQNIGALENFKFVHMQANSSYVCHCDGDDYWLPGKLQAQADFLDQHPECNVVFTRSLIKYEPKAKLYPDLMNCQNIPESGFNRADALRLIVLGLNSSKMYRRPSKKITYPNFLILDYFETVEQIGNGKAYYVNENFYTVYRANIGIATDGVVTRKLLYTTFEFFCNKYPNQRVDINVAVLTLLLTDLKNLRKSVPYGLAAFLKTFHIGSLPLFLKSLPIILSFKFPKEKNE